MRQPPRASDEPSAASPQRPRLDSPSPSPLQDIRRYLSEDAEQEVVAVLCEQFRHEQRITSDDVRFVARSIASHNGALAIPSNFPPMRWILDFKRVHDFTQFSSFVRGLPTRINVGRSSRSSSGDEEERELIGRSYSVGQPSYYIRYAMRPSYDSDSYLQMHHSQRQQQQHAQQQRRSMVVNGRRTSASRQKDGRGGDPEKLGSNSSNGSFDSENGTTTGSSSNASVVASAPASSVSTRKNYESQDGSSTSNEKRGYKLSHTVPPETWENAIAAVEQQGMSLRSAAKMYGVHFAALHRRVKKRAQGGSAKGISGYFHPSDEAGIMRVVVARAELGVLMTFDELMKLVETAALRKLPDISVDAARKLIARFQSRNEQSIRHIIVDWPPPRPTVATSSGNDISQQQHYHLEHPGYDYGSEATTAHRSFATRSADGSGGAATAAAVATAPPVLFQLPSRIGSFSPSYGSTSRSTTMNGVRKPMGVGDALPTPPKQSQRLVAVGMRAPRDKDTNRPVMFV
ncbi:hypothetical protein BBP00_00009929 [Phytophthora kernoviae]|uniref:HTH psq-type domain-containing protein n=1 Tax=Phytophthora kernoviae TaxID=325452 RepID=A0A3F2RB80_9STRA|nr:hypothetical protein BBP00_00009929 [Phytophthora kernoviae]